MRVEIGKEALVAIDIRKDLACILRIEEMWSSDCIKEALSIRFVEDWGSAITFNNTEWKVVI